MLRFKTLSRTPNGAVYVQPETGYTVPWLTSFDDVIVKIRDHRVAHSLVPIDPDPLDVESQMASTLKMENPDEYVYDTEVAYIPWLVRYGRQMWAELHAYAFAYPINPSENDKLAAQNWMNGWTARIPSTNCNCALKWAQLGMVPDLAGRETFYRWSVQAHDVIRSYLNQPIMDGEFRTLV